MFHFKRNLNDSHLFTPTVIDRPFYRGHMIFQIFKTRTQNCAICSSLWVQQWKHWTLQKSVVIYLSAHKWHRNCTPRRFITDHRKKYVYLMLIWFSFVVRLLHSTISSYLYSYARNRMFGHQGFQLQERMVLALTLCAKRYVTTTDERNCLREMWLIANETFVTKLSYIFALKLKLYTVFFVSHVTHLHFLQAQCR